MSGNYAPILIPDEKDAPHLAEERGGAFGDTFREEVAGGEYVAYVNDLTYPR